MDYHVHMVEITPNGPCPHCEGTGHTPDLVAIGAQLRALREAAGLSLRDLAKLLHCSHVYLGDLERGLRPIPARRIAQYEQIERLLKGDPA